jgi:hypothetical protein
VRCGETLARKIIKTWAEQHNQPITELAVQVLANQTDQQIHPMWIELILQHAEGNPDA